MKTYNSFIFDSYDLDLESKKLSLHYSLDDELHFTETFSFDFEFANNLNEGALQQACKNIFMLAGVSYFKTYLPQNIVVKQVSLSPSEAEFYSKTYQKGLGEFFFVNQLDPKTSITFPSTDSSADMQNIDNKGVLIGLGGGKDSLVSVELLRHMPKVATWSMGHRQQLEPLVQKIGLPHFWVEREWDPQLIELNNSGAFNGHIPISAIIAAVGTLVALLSGYQDHVVSNENSANEPTLTYQGVEINHQYSKSLEFETAYQALLKEQFGDSLRYYSVLRPLSEVRIAELFASNTLTKYEYVFSSCNRAFRHDSHKMFWCGECPKCAFVFLALTPFVEQSRLERIFGKNLLLDTTLEPTYRELLGIQGDKPLECVGEVKENRAAMRLAQEIYPTLKEKYTFDLPEEYDYRAQAGHAIPQEIFKQISSWL